MCEGDASSSPPCAECQRLSLREPMDPDDRYVYLSRAVIIREARDPIEIVWYDRAVARVGPLRRKDWELVRGLHQAHSPEEQDAVMELTYARDAAMAN